jgi:hypothetical protein
MTTLHGSPMTTDARLDPPKNDCGCCYHEDQRAYGGTPQSSQTIKSHAATQATRMNLQSLVMEVVTALLLNDHVMHNHTTSYHSPPTYGLKVVCSSRVTDNSQLSLEHTKCPLYTFFACLLLFGKPLLILCLRITYRLH